MFGINKLKQDVINLKLENKRLEEFLNATITTLNENFHDTESAMNMMHEKYKKLEETQNNLIELYLLDRGIQVVDEKKEAKKVKKVQDDVLMNVTNKKDAKKVSNPKSKKNGK